MCHVFHMVSHVCLKSRLCCFLWVFCCCTLRNNIHFVLFTACIHSDAAEKSAIYKETMCILHKKRERERASERARQRFFSSFSFFFFFFFFLCLRITIKYTIALSLQLVRFLLGTTLPEVVFASKSSFYSAIHWDLSEPTGIFSNMLRMLTFPPFNMTSLNHHLFF